MKYRRQYPCRCRKCTHRKTLPKHPSAYARDDTEPKCWYCGAQSWRVDEFRRLREHRKYACDCRGIEGVYDFKGAPHRRGSKWCKASKADINWTEFSERFPNACPVNNV